jgi:replicative DNA helicase
MVNSREEEMSIIGTIMYDPALFSRIYGTVKPEDFYDPVCRKLFVASVYLAEKGLDINVQTVFNYLKLRNDDSLTETEIYDFLEYRVSAEIVVSFAAQVSEFSGYRILQSELDSIHTSVRNREMSLGEYLTRLNALSNRINAKGVNQEFKTGQVLMENYLALLGREKNTLKLTGIPEIDSQIFDLDAKEVTYIAARPGVGKSAVMLQSARVNLEHGKRIGFISMEMDNSKIMNRLISSRARVDGTELLSNMDLARFRTNDALMEALQWYTAQPLFIDDTGPFTDVTIPQKIRKMVYEHECDLVYVDYIGLIRASGSLSGRNRNEQMTSISGDIKGLASELNIPIIAASQLSREVTKLTTGRPVLSHLRDSGSLEQDGSIVAFVYVDMEKFEMAGLDASDLESYVKNSTELDLKFEVAKQRNGPIFVEPLVMQKKFGIFTPAKSYRATY